jgi:hypothetical protein
MGNLERDRKKLRQRRQTWVPRSQDDTPVVDDMTIMTILFLAIVSSAINDSSSHEIHKRTVASLVSARGGLQNITSHNGLVMCTLMQWESFWALNTGSSIFPESRPKYLPRYPSIAPIPMATTLGKKASTLPAGFQILAHRKRLALDLLEVLFRTADAQVEQALYGSVVSSDDVFGSKPRRFQDFWEACTCFAAPDEPYTYTSATDNIVMTMLPNLEKLIALALLLYCLHTFSPMRSITAVYNGTRKKLTSDAPRRIKCYARLPDTQDTASMDTSEIGVIESEEDVLLWVYFNLTDSWRAADDTLLPQGTRIMHDIRKRFPERTARWGVCEEALKKYFWHENFIRRCRLYWEAVSMGREEVEVAC